MSEEIKSEIGRLYVPFPSMKMPETVKGENPSDEKADGTSWQKTAVPPLRAAQTREGVEEAAINNETMPENGGEPEASIENGNVSGNTDSPSDSVRDTPAADTSYVGNLQISVVSTIGLVPVANATVTVSYTGDPESPIQVLTTDSSGQTPTIELPAPPLSLSLNPEAEQQPYSEYNIFVTAEGYEDVLVSGSEILAGELSLQPIRMNPTATTEEEEKIVIIPAHTLFGEYPPKIPEEEIKPTSETGEIVLSRVVIPEYIIVHDGVPGDSTAPNYWVRYKDYIKNVASSEIYSTWPESTIYANILVIQSFTLNRVYTEWYLRAQ